MKKNYQNFVTYEKFAKQLDMSLMDYISMNADIAINRPRWARAAKALNKKLGGQLSDEVIEVLSKRISSYSPTIKGVEGSQRVSLDTKELLFNFIKRANTPPDGQYFACMLEDFANMPNGKTLTFMPDNGWLVKNKAEGVQRSYSSSIQLKNNDVKMIDKDNITGERYPTNIIKFPLSRNNRIRLHPTQKPVELLEYLIKTYTNEYNNCRISWVFSI